MNALVFGLYLAEQAVRFFELQVQLVEIVFGREMVDLVLDLLDAPVMIDQLASCFSIVSPLIRLRAVIQV